MQIVESVKLSQLLNGFRAAEVAHRRPTGIVSPWSEGELEKFVWSDILGAQIAPMTRKEAMSVPAVAAARHRIVQLADRPLRALNGNDTDTTSSHSWLYRTDTEQTPWERMAHTLDDWLFYGDTVWVVARNADNTLGDAVRLPYDRWEFDTAGRMMIDGEYPDEGTWLYLRAPFDGLLNVATETIRAAQSIERAWAARVRNPNPTVILEEREDSTVSTKEAKTYVEQVTKAMRSPDGAVMFTPAKINLRLEGDAGTNVLENARNAVRIDIANFVNLNASALDGAKPQSSLTYETQQTETQELQDRLAFWTAPLEARLSMDDVVPRGQRVRFDFAHGTPAQTGTPTED